MKTFRYILLIILTSNSIFSQDKFLAELKNLTEKKEYKTIINEFSTKENDYSAESLYYIGQAFYMLEDDNNCVKFMNLAIAKNPKDSKAYFILGSTQNYMQKYDDAVKSFESAISINPEDGKFYSGLGDSYYNQNKLELALNAYISASKQKNAEGRAFSMIAQIYSEQKNNEKALESFYIAKTKVSKDSNSYINALFNIGLFETLKGNYDNAENTYKELIKLSPNDFHSYAKLVQIYYHKKEYEKAKPFKEKLYTEYKNGNLKDNLKDMFCFDQFKWNNKLIQAFERFQENSKDIFNKHIFYVINEKDEIEFKIQTEFSPISLEQGGAKYLLCMSKGNAHFTYNVGFNDDLNYENLKKSVIDILEDKIKPAASSRPSK